jgi:K+-transporting ATPase ATPase B chain
VIRESGGDFSSVTGGTRVLSDWLVVRVTVNQGEAFIDRMIAMVESARRQKTPNEIALTILLVAMTLIFLLATVTLLPFSLYAVDLAKAGSPVTITVLVALLVCLIPTTIGGLLSAIGLAGSGGCARTSSPFRPRGGSAGRRGHAAPHRPAPYLRRRASISCLRRDRRDLADAAQLAAPTDRRARS